MYINNDINYVKYAKKKEIFIFAAGEEGKAFFQVANSHGLKIVGFIDNNCNCMGKQIDGVEVSSLESFINYNDNRKLVVICSRKNEKAIKEQLLMGNVFNFCSQDQFDFGSGYEYYDENYFTWQKTVGEFGGKYKSKIFKPYVGKNDVVVEFGSGGGYLLANLDAKEKVGIEINDSARVCSKDQGIRAVKYSKELPDGFADVIISTHALEHTENPLEELRILHSKLKEEGKIVFHVPNEPSSKEYKKNDFNNHLYSWNPLTLGNLFKSAGFFVYKIERIVGAWPMGYESISQSVSQEEFDFLVKMEGHFSDENSILIVAYK